ncbi:hypothetical protein FS749_007483 [Ceratobasidium sp. UAMH 11750]|nr:hypothetical protein FS749_007483 [Ceratobasidium sp. UAMH 11750]
MQRMRKFRGFPMHENLSVSRATQFPHPLPTQAPSNPDNPNIQRVQAIVLPSSSPQYYFASVELQSHSGPLRTVRWLPRLSQIFGDKTTADVVSTNGTGGRRLRSPLHFFFEVPPKTMPRATNLQRNESVYTLTGETPHPWKGDIVVMKFNGGNRRGYQDVQDSDLRAIAYFFFQKNASNTDSEPMRCFPYYTWRG